MPHSQPGILAPVPPQARFIELRAVPEQDPAAALKLLAKRPVTEALVVGLGAGLVQGLGLSLEELHAFRALTGPGCEVPATQADLWLWLRGEDAGQIAHDARMLVQDLAPAFVPVDQTNGFKYKTGLDLSGYQDGTENPEGAAAEAAAFADGSSFVSVQKWVHDLARFDGFPLQTRDNIIGRRASDDVELADAPIDAHVKRTAQESFEPEAFVVRRSMPWSDTRGEGLQFVAFGNSFYAFEAQMRRMAGLEDGILDALFRFSRPVSGSNFWCPPVKDGRLDLSMIGM